MYRYRRHGPSEELEVGRQIWYWKDFEVFELSLVFLLFFLARARCLSAGLRYLRLTRPPRHDRGPVPGGNRSAASCLCTVLRRALYHYATRSPLSLVFLHLFASICDYNGICHEDRHDGSYVSFTFISERRNSEFGSYDIVHESNEMSFR